MTRDEVTIDEAVPLVTVRLQRLLADRAVRALVFKGPAFVALGFRLPRRSNDFDLLIHPGERDAAWSALRAAGWESVTPTYPASTDPFYFSVTFAHRLSPGTLDLHHRILGLMRDPGEVFEAMLGAARSDLPRPSGRRHALRRSRSCRGGGEHDQGAHDDGPAVRRPSGGRCLCQAGGPDGPPAASGPRSSVLHGVRKRCSWRPARSLRRLLRMSVTAAGSARTTAARRYSISRGTRPGTLSRTCGITPC